MQRVTRCPSIPSSGRGCPAPDVAGLGAIACPGVAAVAVLPGPCPAALQSPLDVRTTVAEAGFGRSGTRGGPPLRRGGPRGESCALRGRVLPHGCSRDPPAFEKRSNARRLVTDTPGWRNW